ncbi:MAG: IS110 family transposase [Hydrogenophilales bacterium]|nr:IS110 family transposase [Hydrogenophilales bacterium]
MKPQINHIYAAYIGIDWADQKHDICLQAAGADTPEFAVLAHRPDSIEAWALSLKQRFHGQPIAVCLELAKGPIVYALQKYDFLVLFPVNPSTLAKYRQAFTPSNAKDDPSDARLQLELLMQHRDKLKPLQPEGVEMRTLQYLVEQRRGLVNDRVRLTNQLTYALKQYFPQVLEWFKDKDTLVFCDFLSRWSTLKQAQQARKTTLEAFFHAHHVRYPKVIEARVSAIKAAMPLTSDVSVILPHQLLVQALAQQLRVLLASIEHFDTKIAAISQALPDYPLFQALPGAGPIYAPRLLAAFGEQRARYQSAAELQKYAGIAPVTERSGKKCWVHWRLQCPKFLRQTFVEWAAETIPRSFWAGAYYRQKREKGCSHQAALRALAFKWVRILYRCWQTRTPYDESSYLNALKRRGSSLLNSIREDTKMA